jgi:hypothetical protein
MFMSMKVARTSHVLRGYQNSVEDNNELRNESFSRLRICLSELEGRMKQPVFISEMLPDQNINKTQISDLIQPSDQDSRYQSNLVMNSPQDLSNLAPASELGSELFEDVRTLSSGKFAPQTSKINMIQDSNLGSETRNRRETRRQTFFGQADAITEELFSSRQFK